MKPLKIIVIAGSNRAESINRRLARALIRLAPADGFDLELLPIDTLPMYNPDLEGARPPEVVQFCAAVAAADGVLLVTPEHNRSIPAVLKNAIDWGSKPVQANVWKGKPVAITGASPGALGAAIGQLHLRQIMGILGALVMGGETYISYTPGLVDDAHAVVIDSTRQFLAAFLENFLAVTARLAATG